MCAIIDTNAVSEVFGSNLPPAGVRFFDWLNKGSGRLVVGGKLLDELEKNSTDFRRWGQEAQLAGKMRIVNKGGVDARTEQLQSEGAITSDDPHVIALAQVSGARLLYTNDRRLQEDFKNIKIDRRSARKSLFYEWGRELSAQARQAVKKPKSVRPLILGPIMLMHVRRHDRENTR